MAPSPTVLFLGFVWPEPTSSAAGTRNIALVDGFLEAGWKVVYGSASPDNEFSAALRARGALTVAIAPNDSAFDRFVAELRPEYAIFDRFVMEEQFGWRVRDHAPETVRVLDTIDLHFLRRARERAHQEGAPLELHTKAAFRELGAIHRSDLTLVLSSFELELLTKQLGMPASLLELAPFSYAGAPPLAGLPPWSMREGFATIGNFRHAPNADATYWLHRELWPEIRARLPEARVHVYGAYPPREIMALHDPARGFHVEGPAPEALTSLKAHRVNLAPLRFGAGVKGKIADGWIAGLPAVTTPVGAEGMGEAPWGGVIAKTVAELAEAAVRLYTDPVEWERARQAGRRILEEHFAQARNAPRLLHALSRCRDELHERRRANLTGALLWHHQYRSTTYFSRWIELKESLNAHGTRVAEARHHESENTTSAPSRPDAHRLDGVLERRP